MRIHLLRLIFQRKLPLGPLLHQTDHLARDVVPVLVPLQVGAKPDPRIFTEPSVQRPTTEELDDGMGLLL